MCEVIPPGVCGCGGTPRDRTAFHGIYPLRGASDFYTPPKATPDQLCGRNLLDSKPLTLGFSRQQIRPVFQPSFETDLRERSHASLTAVRATEGTLCPVVIGKGEREGPRARLMRQVQTNERTTHMAQSPNS